MVNKEAQQKQDKDSRPAAIPYSRGQIAKKQVITVNSGAYCTAVNCYYLYRWGIKWNTTSSIT